MVALPGYPPSLDGLEKALLGEHLGYEAVVKVAAARAANDERRVGFGGRHAASRCRAWRELVLFCAMRRLLRSAVPLWGRSKTVCMGRPERARRSSPVRRLLQGQLPKGAAAILEALESMQAQGGTGADVVHQASLWAHVSADVFLRFKVFGRFYF